MASFISLWMRPYFLRTEVAEWLQRLAVVTIYLSLLRIETNWLLTL